MLATDRPETPGESHAPAPTAPAAAEAPAPAPAPVKMQAIVLDQYGPPDVLRLAAVETPPLGERDVRVRVHAASVAKGDVHLMTGKPYLLRAAGFGLLRPRHRVPGQDMAGRVEAVGRLVTTLRPGDEVYGELGSGALAEYACAREDQLAPKPQNLSFEQAAAVPCSAVTALQGLRDVGGLRAGQRVLINGASGGVGTFAVQIARALGAEVTAVCSTRHLEAVRALGAHHVIDYTQEDFAAGDRRYDIFLDLVGNRSLADCRRVLAPKGVFVACSGSPGGNWLGPVLWMGKVVLVGAFVSQKLAPLVTRPGRADLLVLKDLIEAGKVTPCIERTYPLSATAEAMRHLMNGHAQGKTVIRIVQDGPQAPREPLRPSE